MENYDTIGKWQTVDKLGDGAINPVATVNFGNGNMQADQQLARADAGARQDAEGPADVRAEPGSPSLRPRPNANDQCVADDIATKLGGRRLHRLSTFSPTSPRRTRSACASSDTPKAEELEHENANPTRTFLRGLGGSPSPRRFSALSGSGRRRGRRCQAEAVHRDVHPLRVHHDEVLPREVARRRWRPATSGDEPRGPRAVRRQAPHPARHPRDERVDSKQQRHGRARSGERPAPERRGVVLHPAAGHADGTDPFSFDTAYKFNALPIGSSLDHVIAQQLSPNGTPLFMRVGNRMDGAQSGISYLKCAGRRRRCCEGYPGLGTPSQVFTALTGLFDKGHRRMTPRLRDASRPEGLRPRQGRPRVPERMVGSADDMNKVDVWGAAVTTWASS